jgi:hypothetical protein
LSSDSYVFKKLKNLLSIVYYLRKIF